MRKIWIVAALLLLIAMPVAAFSGITSAQNLTTVYTDGSCDVTLTVSLELEAIPESLLFPLPANASDITVNGTEATVQYSSDAKKVDLRGFVSTPGSYSLIIRYHQSNVIVANEDELFLTLQLLSGFDYPVDSLSFSITLPATVEEHPTFVSTYYQDTIETMMTVNQKEHIISGITNQRLQDHETLTMSLKVSDEMFPQPAGNAWSMDTVDLLMICVAVLALIYWLVSMRCPLSKRLRCTMPPEGINAGAIGSCLTGTGADFTLMVISWAQMGYILIQPDDNGRVLLHKRMEMGNERSEFENRYFRKLFGKRNVVDGTGYHYAKLCRGAVQYVPGAQDHFRRDSGNPKVFRVLAILIGGLSGISMAQNMVSNPTGQVLLCILLFLLGSVAAWLIQSAAQAIHSRFKLRILLGLAAAAVWLTVEVLAGQWNVGIFVVPAQFLAGLAASYGGRRTENGKQTMGEILGLRHYLKKLSGQELKRILKANPHYYYDLAPYACALGVDRQFARHLRKARLPQCPYLTSGMDGHLTAQEWDQLLRDTVQSLDALQKRLPIERLMGR